jgi:hypothetical protein
MDYTPTTHTIVFMSAFLVLYAALLVRHTVRHRIDLFDFAMLALLAIVPGTVVWFPGLIVRITRLVGVEFPFVVMFGALFLVVFVYLYSLVVRINLQHRTIITLVQEVGLLRETLEHDRRGATGAASTGPSEQARPNVAAPAQCS